MSFKEYKTLDLTEISNKISDYWDKDKTFEKSISLRDDSEDFVFFEGPPSANGMPSIDYKARPRIAIKGTKNSIKTWIDDTALGMGPRGDVIKEADLE